MYKVKLDYFTDTGKWYSEGEFEYAMNDPLFKIWDWVRACMDENCLPGLKSGHSDFMVSVDVPDHPHNHPVILIPRTWQIMTPVQEATNG